MTPYTCRGLRRVRGGGRDCTGNGPAAAPARRAADKSNVGILTAMRKAPAIIAAPKSGQIDAWPIVPNIADALTKGQAWWRSAGFPATRRAIRSPRSSPPRKTSSPSRPGEALPGGLFQRR